ncbi:hypothetical protein FH966_02615 [Lentibacillus cibarius]|uniref:Uncharacterized protein n=1 Tax=Lentibacillus cibarius TaxID=2583219 RepID=A0A549YFP7_9BACI|nr:hypothetical protein [Lentibacillus cibarius]TMN21888.1 hypothetical protein FFL34_06995 [Lentibacillus cibarius]TRM10695.1 hypothetical protein FH966_02615 [Lentibacillus cibarius]
MRKLNDSKGFCPFCGADLQGEPIPEEMQHQYGATHFSRKIGISSIEEDRIVKWQCPDCGKEWERE